MDKSPSREIWGKIKNISLKKDDFFLFAVIFLVALASFGIGRLSVIYNEKDHFEIVYPENQQASAINVVVERNYVASISGTKYHLPTCSGAKSIKKENQIWFSTKEEAEQAGYAPAANCKGI